MTATGRRDVYAEITAKIVDQLEKGVRPWARPWNGKHAAGDVTRPLRYTGEGYRGINVLSLWMSAEERGFSCPIWMTFKQVHEFEAHVRKGEKGSPVFYAGTLAKEEESENGDTETVEVRYLKHYTVFNCEQIEGLPERFYAKADPNLNPDERDAAAEAFFANTKADVRHGGDSAFYRPAEDFIQMPAFKSFRDGQSYYATLAHESTHWTRHPSRLDRSFDQKRFGDDGYAREELVAEIGSAMLCADLGLALEPREDHASYLACWLKVLKEDSRAIFQAAAHAERAATFLHGLQPKA